MTPEKVNAKIAENFDKYVKKVSKSVVQYFIIEKDLTSLSTFASKFCRQFNCRIAM